MMFLTRGELSILTGKAIMQRRCAENSRLLAVSYSLLSSSSSHLLPSPTTYSSSQFGVACKLTTLHYLGFHYDDNNNNNNNHEGIEHYRQYVCKKLEISSQSFTISNRITSAEALVSINAKASLLYFRSNRSLINERRPYSNNISHHQDYLMAAQLPLPAYASAMLNKLSARLMSTIMPPQKSHSTGSGLPIKSSLNPKGHKRARINACGELYAELAVSKPSLYASAPKNKGMNLELGYYDSFELLDSRTRDRAPVVCLLHGAPGHYKDFHQLINHLTEKGIRVLAPRFPGYSATYDYSFRHSPRERLDCLLKFFEAIDVQTIDMIIGHSSAVYTLFELLDHSLSSTNQQHNIQKIQIKSIGLFNTPTYNLPPNLAVTPFRLFTLKLFDYPMLRPIILALIHTFVRLQGIQNKVNRDKIEDLLIAASAMGYSESERMVKHLRLVQDFKIPTFVLIGCHDRLIPMHSFEQLKQDLGVSGDTQVKQYSESGQLIRDVVGPNDLVRVSQFAAGGHYTFQKYADQVNEDVYKFLTDKLIATTSVESTKL